ncbi:uncharacterized protein LOC131934894 [Physella acuta]|uniref:uncharacterized protein LOC131934894 n=1 Tax=Physella acuta TaxID=109671 RepID=UPI0027DC0CF6|nr:uncharacterized protein LOC131934894 [Physella acuta]
MVNMGILQLTIVTSLVLGALCQVPCTQSGACTCSRSDGWVIDLTPLKDQRFEVPDAEGAYKYDIEFCQTFSLNNSACQGVYGCQFNSLISQYFSIGKTATFNHTEKMVLKDGDRTTLIAIQCLAAGNDSLKFISENPPNTYNFQLDSTHACPVLGPTTPTTTQSTTSNTTQTSTSTSTANTTSTTATTTTTPSNTTHTTSNTTASTVTTKTTPSSNSTSTTSQSTSTSTKTTSATTTSTAKTTPTAASKTTKKGKANSLSSATVGVLMLVACITRSLF